MFMISNPCKVRQAVSNEKKPIPGFVSRLMRSLVLFNEIVEVLHPGVIHSFQEGELAPFISHFRGIAPQVATSGFFPSRGTVACSTL
jgi:hypothetical protein